VLREEGHDIVLVQHLDDAAADLAPDLVITDLVGLHGYDTALARSVLRPIQSRYPDVPIVLCTGHEKAVHEYAQLGASAVVRKPFTLESLVRAVAEALTR
jgi:CheY-like chemotaxis protein